MQNLKIYLRSILIPVVIGGGIGLIISTSIDYNSLQKPFLSPPSIAFPIVWTILYILMGISYGILKVRNKVDDKINLVYYLQLLVNALWSIFFFSLKWRLFSFLWLIFLIFLIMLMIYQFYQRNKVSGLLQLPYLLWCFFAAYLNLFTYLLN